MLDVAVYLRALSDRRRLQIAQYLAQHEQVTVTDLGAALRLSQPLISWHLRLLRRAGVVKTNRLGRKVFCSLNRTNMARYQRQIDQIFGLTPSVYQEADQEPVAAETAVHG